MSKAPAFISQKVSFPVEGVEATRRLRVSGTNPDMSDPPDDCRGFFLPSHRQKGIAWYAPNHVGLD
jgi:hypothetical protein